MHDPLILERAQAHAQAGDRPSQVPHLLDTTTLALHRQFATDFVWTCLRMPGEPSIPLSSAGREALAADSAIVWIGDQPHLAPELQREVVALGTVCYQDAVIDFVLGRAGRPFSPAEGTRFARLRASAQRALNRASIYQCEQALRFQEGLLRRREADCRRLQGELASRERMLSVLNHDLVNDLTPVAYASEELTEYQGLPEAMLRHLVLIDRQCVRMRQRLRQGLSNLHVPNQAEPGHLDMRAIVVEMADAWRVAFDGRRQPFTLSMPASPLPVHACESDLVTIVSNLLSNANKYTPSGGRIDLRLVKDRAEVLLEVSDSGVGMSPAMRRRLFELGAREHLGVEGHGLGLHQVATIVRRLRGTIDVESQLHRGTTFWVRLPLRD